MRIREQIDELIAAGVAVLQTRPGLCSVTSILSRRRVIGDYEDFIIDDEIEEIGNVLINPRRDHCFFLGIPNKSKEFRAIIWALAIEKLYGEGEL